MVEWLLQHKELLTLVLALVTAAGVFLGPFFAEKVRQRFEERREGVKQLKEFVLRRIQQRLEEDYLPMLRNEQPVVGIVHGHITKERARLDEPANEPQEYLAAIEPDDHSHAPTSADYYRARTKSEFHEPKFLWQNARKQFPKFLKSWDEFCAFFKAYAQACLQEIDRARHQILESSQLPEFTPTFPKPPWVNARWLAWYTFFRVMGLEEAQNVTLEVEQKTATWALVSQHSSTVAEGSKEQAEKCLRIANTLAETAQWKEGIELARRGLLDKAVALHEDAQRLLLLTK